MRWFLYDESARSRTATTKRVPLIAVEKVRNLLERVNPYVHTVRRAMSTVDPETIPIAVELRDFPADGEVAAIINMQNLSTVNPRKVLYFTCSGQCHFMHILSRHYEPLQYPLFFPHGNPGWGISEASNSNSNETDDRYQLTQQQWYRSLLLGEPRFCYFGRLTCEYLVDMFSRIEDARLHYLRYGRTLQTSGLDHVTDHLKADWMRNRLPSSFTGSRAWASEQVADALALARKFGKPTFFITMTTNPNWPEITSNMKPGQVFTDIPVIVCRAFNLRMKYLKNFIKDHFGTTLYFISVVEFQKRCLPHCHMLIKVRNVVYLSKVLRTD